MNPRPWTSTRRLFAGLRIGAVSALIVLAPVLLPSHAVFAHETRGSTTSTTNQPSAKYAVELEGTPAGGAPRSEA